MRMWLGGASNWLSFSSQIGQPSLALAKVTALSHRAFIGPTDAAHTRLASDIHPTDILDRRLPLREADGVVLMVHLLSLAFPIPVHFLRCTLATRDPRARNPTYQGERQLMLDRHSSLATLDQSRWLLQQAVSTLDALVGGQLSLEGGSLFPHATSQNVGSPAPPSTISPSVSNSPHVHTQTIIS